MNQFTEPEHKYADILNLGGLPEISVSIRGTGDVIYSANETEAYIVGNGRTLHSELVNIAAATRCIHWKRIRECNNSELAVQEIKAINQDCFKDEQTNLLYWNMFKMLAGVGLYVKGGGDVPTALQQCNQGTFARFIIDGGLVEYIDRNKHQLNISSTLIHAAIETYTLCNRPVDMYNALEKAILKRDFSDERKHKVQPITWFEDFTTVHIPSTV